MKVGDPGNAEPLVARIPHDRNRRRAPRRATETGGDSGRRFRTESRRERVGRQVRTSAQKKGAGGFLPRSGRRWEIGRLQNRRSPFVQDFGFHGPVRAKLFRAHHRVKPANPEPRLRGPLFLVLRTRGRSPAIRVPRWIGVVRSFVSAPRLRLTVAQKPGRGLTPHQVLCFRKQTRVAIDAEARGSSATLRDPPLRVRKKTLLPEPPAGHDAVSPDRRPARRRNRSRQSARPVRRANRIARRRI